MHVEWQGDHRLLGDDLKQDFERELTRLGLDPSKFLAEVRREPDMPEADGLDAIPYDVYITDLEHPDRDTWKLQGGHGENWIAQFAQIRRCYLRDPDGYLIEVGQYTQMALDRFKIDGS